MFNCPGWKLRGLSVEVETAAFHPTSRCLWYARPLTPYYML